MRVSVIVPTYKDWNRLKICIQALARQTYPKESYEIIVVNNDPTDVYPLEIKQNKGVSIILLTEPKPGSYHARNTGLRCAKGDIIAFTDSDCQPDPDWILSAVNFFVAYPDSDRIAGKIDLFRDENSSWTVWMFDSITAFNQRYNVEKGVSVTANLFVRKDVFLHVGDFDSSMLSGGDIEWGNRASKAGFSLHYSDDIVVKHPARSSWKELFNKFRRITGGRFLKAKQKKHLILFFFWHFIPPIRYTFVLHKEKKSLIALIFAVTTFWIFKLLMLFEFVRLFCGGRPVR